MNKFSISSSGIGEALKRSASSLSESNNSLEESIALITTANSVVQDPEKVGTALRTLSLRVRGVKTELEEAGLETDGMVESTAKLRSLIMSTTGVDILEKDQKTFKSTYDILLDMSKVWNTIDDELQKSAVLEALAGKMQSNILASILNNGEMLADVYEKANDSENSAMQEQERWADSLEAKSQHIEAIFESISTKVFKSESLKSIYDGLGNILEIIDKIVEKGQGLQLLAGTLGGVLGASGNGIINVSTIGSYWKEVNSLINNYNRSSLQGAEAQRTFAINIQGTNAKLSEYLRGLNGAKAGVLGYTASVVAAGVETVATKAIVIAFNAIINGGLMLGVSALISLISSWVNHNKELTASLKESSDKLEDSLTSLDDYKDKIDKIVESENDEYEKLSDLKKIKEELEDKYDIEIGKIKDVTKARKLLNDEIEKQTINERKTYLEKNQEAYETAKKKVSDNRSTGFFKGISDWFVDTTMKNIDVSLNKGTSIFSLTGKFKDADKISKDIQDLFDSSNKGLSKTSFILGESAKDEIEYFDILHSKLLEFYDIANKPGRVLTEQEQTLYDTMQRQYDELEKSNSDYIKNIEDYSKQKAQYIIDTVKRTNEMTDEQYRFLLMTWADNDIYVANAIDEILSKTNEAKDAIKSTASESNSALSDIISNLSKLDSALSDVDEKIGKADEKFEDLLKTIESNKDTDKFFTSSEIVEILDKYPSLNDAIMECTYGYKIQSEALENLRATKLEEEKTALQTQLSEAKGLWLVTNEKISAYEAELGEIKNVADAKIKLAELETKLENIQNSKNLPHIKQRKVNTVEEQIASLKDYVSASEGLSDAEEKMKALQVQLNVLGQDHDKLSDSTNDTTKALNAEKDAINDLNDAMKDAQDDINNLLELTMAMIKKNAELEKEALKERLDEYKKLIDKQKELIDLEKEEADFKSDLAEKDKDYLKIQQELDSLSIEGASYSLEDMKRKEELTEELAEKEKDRTDFLYDHEVDVRKNALDKEADAFEDQINTQTKAIEDYLDHEGRIRQDAVDLINGKSEQFYNDLLSYTMNYTDKSRYEFEQLWTKAYDAIMKYANGQLNVDLALMNLMVELELNEQKLKAIEAQTDSLKETTTDYIESAKNGYSDLNKVLNETEAILSDIGNAPTVNASDLTSWQNVGKANETYAKWVYDAKNLLSKISTKAEKHHSGGIVGGVSNEHGEILTKLLKGEVVVTESQARNFMENTLPKLSGNVTTNNSSVAPVINIGDIVVQGNADSDVISQLKTIRQGIADDVFKAINNQKNIFNGGRIRTV